MNQQIPNEEEDRRLRQQLQHAVQTASVPPYLEARIRANRHSSNRFGWLSPALAALAVVISAGIAYRFSEARMGDQESYIATVTNSVSSLMRVGLVDHIHCALFRKYPDEAPTLEAVAKDLPVAYRGLLPIVAGKMPEEFHVQMAHECLAEKRKFIHLILRSDQRMVSVVLAVKQNGESFDQASLIPALSQSGISFYRTSADKFEIASFESSKHLIYVISDLNGAKNMNLMLALAPEMTTYLKKLES